MRLYSRQQQQMAQRKYQIKRNLQRLFLKGLTIFRHLRKIVVRLIMQENQELRLVLKEMLGHLNSTLLKYWQKMLFQYKLFRQNVILTPAH